MGTLQPPWTLLRPFGGFAATLGAPKAFGGFAATLGAPEAIWGLCSHLGHSSGEFFKKAITTKS